MLSHMLEQKTTRILLQFEDGIRVGETCPWREALQQGLDTNAIICGMCGVEAR